MASTVENGQTCLEKRGMEERHQEITCSDYNIEDQYGPTHKDAISDGDPQGKGTGHGGHTHFLPDCTKPTTTINYSNFDSENGGGYYDIEGRNGISGRKRALATSLYNKEIQYGPTLVDTSANVAEGQYYFGQQIGQKTYK
ncbi:MAG: hypothetical protein J6O49_14480 [Bacteroidaceae bacterium]|nr:hypothetical protein [Bacteroidaceae bacterium]